MAGRSKADAKTTSRLSMQDWLDAALGLLIREGVGEVKISRLCDELHVTKGSFYWHFADINALMNALAAHWRTSQVEAMEGLAQIESIPADQRLEQMAGMLVERDWSVEAAIREWALRNDEVADSVRDLDRRIFDLVREALIELDLSEEDARLRAGILVFAGIGFIHGHASLPTPTSDDLHALFALLVGDGTSTP